ncbi:MAG: type IV fimbrial biogenesis protein FimT [Oleispira sp.]|jgi:type IV fimbrial biogenesis protein FimT
MDGYMKQQGFTLIELTIVLAIITLLLSAGGPSYRFFINQSRIQSDIGNLLMMLRMTRQQAILSTSTAVLCPSNDDKTCVRNWKLPLIQFIDSNKNKKRDPDETIRQRFPALNSDDVFIMYPKTQVRFDEQGMANFYNGTFGYCLEETVKGIIISRIGRIRFAQDLDGDHIPDVKPNTPVTCI